MTLEQGIDPVSAKWNKDKDTWDVGNKRKYRWVTNDKKPTVMSEWFYELKEALDWIIEYDEVNRSV